VKLIVAELLFTQRRGGQRIRADLIPTDEEPYPAYLVAEGTSAVSPPNRENL
jgi:hypothetical protein